MKNIAYLLLLLAFCACQETSTPAQEPVSENAPARQNPAPDVPAEAPRALKTVEDIQAEYAALTTKLTSGSLDTTSFKYNCHGEKSGRVTYFSENGRLRMIRHVYQEYSHFSATDEYFLQEDTPFFVFYKHGAWSFVDQNQTKEQVTETRFYLIDQQAVQCLQKKSTILSTQEGVVQTQEGTNQKIACPSLQPMQDKVKLFLKLRKQQEDLACLEG